MPDDRVAYYEARKALALETISQIVDRGWTFHRSEGDAPMRDVTAERLAKKRAEVEMMDKFIAMSKPVPGGARVLHVPNPGIV